ncbi:hypothetical protein D0S48_13680 [Psychrobacillus sp. AK 1817]|uniref:hypothetical protein n=1 Tax=Psychrobacillus sp. AK 1817 TaxID=2303505 RepID=UPI0012492514|nr:hypothetical protein [Psychrobacillus sp. AK 1817]QEY21633.1 hypothetical protein D0S48_13680 [Psychrobacillus sp. AK 1817]
MFDDDLDIDDGVYAVPSHYKVKVRALQEYCKSKNVDVEDLTEEEIKQFVVYKKNPLLEDD